MIEYLRRDPRLGGESEPSFEADLDELVQGVVQGERQATRRLPTMSIASNPTSDLSKLTSEAVLAQYEHAAQSVEALGTSVKDSVGKLQAAMDDLVADLSLITKAADHIRDKGKAVQAQIAAASDLSKEIRDICAGFTKKNGGSGG